MGFETIVQENRKAIIILFEVSLWDLKQKVTYKDNPYFPIWSIPMGFETLEFPRRPSDSGIWSIPMGFETLTSALQGKFFWLFEVSLWDLKQNYISWQSICWWWIWSIPMGFETAFYIFNCLRFTIEFEVSLWDLKRENGSFPTIGVKCNPNMYQYA